MAPNWPVSGANWEISPFRYLFWGWFCAEGLPPDISAFFRSRKTRSGFEITRQKSRNTAILTLLKQNSEGIRAKPIGASVREFGFAHPMRADLEGDGIIVAGHRRAPHRADAPRCGEKRSA